MIELPGVQQIGSVLPHASKNLSVIISLFLTYTFTACYYPVRMRAAGVESSVSLSVCLSVSLSEAV